ncbi:MAG: DNA recombination protein RmuC [Gammaproteobacteria bacterium]
MPLIEILLIVLVATVVLLLVLQVMLLTRGRGDSGLGPRLDALKDDNDRIERVLREEQRAGRGELAQSFDQFRGHVQQQMDAMSAQQRERLESFGTRLVELTERTDRGLLQLRSGLAEDSRKTREESTLTLKNFGTMLEQRLAQLTGDNEKRMGDMRVTLEARLKAIQDDNEKQLEKMRATVDEKLQTTLETRLGQSFKLVSERLEAVQRGLGEMQTLATGVGDLKRVLTNVKTRGIFGEVQLAALLEDVLTVEQYSANVATRPGSNERVEFAIRFPGQDRDAPVWLPIDAKFPREDYERLLDAQERADPAAAEAAAAALERRMRDEARSIVAKYVAPPYTTEFAILFLPTEGLYAEVLRRPGLVDSLQREYRVTVVGPTNLHAYLNSLQMGFRTLAIQKRSGEVWQLLGAVKSEFGKFSGILEKAEKQISTVGKSIREAGRKTRTIERRLRGVESLSGGGDEKLLDDDALLPTSEPEPNNGNEYE